MLNSDQNYLISVVGPTAIGKTALAIKLAQHFKTEIVSADSRQFYKEMNIGTAVPSKSELEAVKHHFIQHKSIEELYNVGDFERDAILTLENLHKKNSVVVMVGGSGLYVNAVVKGLDYFPVVDANIRIALNDKLANDGLSDLQEQLKTLDAKTYDTIAIDNPHRVIRALEICIGTGKPYSTFKTDTPKKRPFKTISFGLEAERPIIYDRINKRVDLMLENGLLKEVKSLLPHKYLNALNTVGYKEMFSFLDNEIPLAVAVSEIKKNTRRFAKRQLTWFRKDESIKWFDYETDTKVVIEYLKNEIKKNPAL